jgi:hypothetical protein
VVIDKHILEDEGSEDDGGDSKNDMNSPRIAVVLQNYIYAMLQRDNNDIDDPSEQYKH